MERRFVGIQDIPSDHHRQRSLAHRRHCHRHLRAFCTRSHHPGECWTYRGRTRGSSCRRHAERHGARVPHHDQAVDELQGIEDAGLHSVGVCCCEEVSVFVSHSVCFTRETKMERGYAFANSDIFRGAQERTSLFVLFDW